MPEMVDILNLTLMHEVLHMFGMFPEKGSQIKLWVFAKGHHSILVRQQVDWKDGMPYSLASKKPGYDTLILVLRRTSEEPCVRKFKISTSSDNSQSLMWNQVMGTGQLPFGCEPWQ